MRKDKALLYQSASKGAILLLTGSPPDSGSIPGIASTRDKFMTIEYPGDFYIRIMHR